ncbi:MAG: GNAT family N-acetyltransferase [Anaerolineae bacterium]|jgi:GNAT superfamily N-acetyltransferase
MSAIEIRPVQSARARRTFLTFPWRIYGDDPLWVPPLLPELARRLDPAQGAILRRGEGECFIAWRGGRPVGTICAAEDRPTNEYRGVRECIFGFFEYVDDYAVAEALVDRAVAWARARGLEALFGPFNLDYEDRYGVLIEGRDRPPALMCGHTPAYYQGFMARYGFGPARGDNLAFAIDWQPDSPQARRLFRLADRLRRRGQITVRGADFDDWQGEIDRVHRLLNTALAYLPDHIGWQRDSLAASVAPFRRIADPELILFAEVEGRVVGWLPGIPNLNEAFIQANGLRYPWDYVRLWWHMRRPIASLTLKSVLVEPDYWNRGVSVLLFAEMAQRAWARGYRWADLSMTSEDNPHTPLLAEHMGARLYKRYRVYRLGIT